MPVRRRDVVAALRRRLCRRGPPWHGLAQRRTHAPAPPRVHAPDRRPALAAACLAAPPAGHRRRGSAAAGRPGRAPAVARGRAGEGDWELGSHLHVGPGCEPPFLFCFYFPEIVYFGWYFINV